MSGNGLPRDLDLLEIYNRDPRPSWVVNNGEPPEPETGGNPDANGVEFKSRIAVRYLRLPQLNFRRGGQFSFKFKTTTPEGLLMYNGGRPQTRDLVAVEMFDGHLYLVLDMGDKTHRFKFGRTDQPLNDGRPHSVEVQRTGSQLTLTLDGVSQDHIIPGTLVTLDLGTLLYLGGVDNSDRLSWHFWNWAPRVSRSQQFQGCIWDLVNQDQEINLQTYLRDQSRSGHTFGIDRGCTEEMNIPCSTSPCVRGPCLNTGTGYKCDCSEVPFRGLTCNIGKLFVLHMQMQCVTKMF